VPNNFGTPSDPTISVPLYDSAYERYSRTRFRRPNIPNLDLANSFYEPSGRWPCRGWILLRRGDYDLFDNLYRTDFQLQVDDFTNGPIFFNGLSVVQARCVSRGLVGDPDAVYLLEVTDSPGVLWNPWAQFPTTKQYNCLAPAYPGQYYASSTPGGGGTPWSWDGMVGDLWAQMGSFLGTYPGLPISPAEFPEDWVFPGVPAWGALCDVMDFLGLTISKDLTQAEPYDIVVPGEADNVFAALQAKFANVLEEDLEYIDAGSGRVPGKVTVFFHRKNQYYGTEETVRRDALQWQSAPIYNVTINAPAPYTGAAGTGYLWSDFAVNYDIDNNPLPADVAAAATIASQLVTDYYTRVTRGTLGYSRQVYAGALPFFAGSQVDGVRWYQDYSQGRSAWRTELVRGPQPPWPEIEVKTYGD
jgi:hypothetical protein